MGDNLSLEPKTIQKTNLYLHSITVRGITYPNKLSVQVLFKLYIIIQS